MAYIWNIFKTRNYPTFPELFAAQVKADNEKAENRDVRQLMSALMQLEVVNERVSGNITTRKTAVKSFDWKITADDKSNTQHAEQCRIAERRLERAINSIFDFRIQAAMYGVFALQWDWSNLYSDGKKMPSLFKRFDPTEIEKYSDFEVAFLDASSSTLKRDFVLSVNDLQNNYILEINSDFRRGGVLRRIIQTGGILLNDNLKEWSNFNKKLKGIVQATYQRGATDDEITSAESAVQSVVSNNYTMSSDAISFMFHSMTDAKGSTSFETLVAKMETAISIAILGQANTTELPTSGGSRAALQVLAKMSSDIFLSDKYATELLVNQLIAQDYRVNFDSSAVYAPWHFEITIPEDVDMTERADFIETLKTNAIPTTSDDVYSILRLNKPDNTPDILFEKAEEPAGQQFF
ncbi:MAG TPA: hypothetical protein DCS19_01565 [Flavobacterium sp.]|nr:hypothetical protein [Flavobacterium sp.]